jgi:hypothetical protein
VATVPVTSYEQTVLLPYWFSYIGSVVGHQTHQDDRSKYGMAEYSIDGDWHLCEASDMEHLIYAISHI